MARISYVDPASLTDPEMLAWYEEAERVGAPRPETQLIRAHQPDVMRSFSRTWQTIFKDGVLAHELKELVRLRIATGLACNY